MNDYYAILGLKKGASTEEIKKSYRKLALQHHPDRNPGNKASEAKFKEISEAYAVLSDDQKRRQYDSFGDQKFHQQYSSEDIFRGADFSSIFRDFDFGGGSSGANGEDIFSKIFGQGFGGGGPDLGGRSRSQKGQDAEYHLKISFLDSYLGAEKQIAYQVSPAKAEEFKLRIPPGVSSGAKLRVAGKGMPARGNGPAGDLFVVVDVQNDSRFSRSDQDLETPIHLKLSEALLGCTKEVETPEGRKKLKIPAHVKPGTKIRLKGLGFPSISNKNQRGDLYAIVEYEIPNNLNAAQTKVIQQLNDVGL